MMRTIFTSTFMLLLSIGNMVVHGYPTILEIAESSERCLFYNIPQDEDAHVVFLALPSAAAEVEDSWVEKQKKIEVFMLSKVLELTKYRVHTTLPRKFVGDAIPADMEELQKEFIKEYGGDLKSSLKITITNPESASKRIMDAFWFTPSVVNHLRRAVRGSSEGGTPLAGYELCFKNTSEEYPVLTVMEAVTTDELDEESEDGKAEIFDGSHLTPLAEQLTESIAAAKTIIKEMTYMENRESRMRQTADSINARVRYFSYISVFVLFVVTYLQVTYLKRYFRKKKLL